MRQTPKEGRHAWSSGTIAFPRLRSEYDAKHEETLGHLRGAFITILAPNQFGIYRYRLGALRRIGAGTRCKRSTGTTTVRRASSAKCNFALRWGLRYRASRDVPAAAQRELVKIANSLDKQTSLRPEKLFSPSASQRSLSALTSVIADPLGSAKRSPAGVPPYRPHNS